MNRIKILTMALFLLVAMFTGCKKDDNPTTPPNTPAAVGSYSGIISGGTQSGTLSITITGTTAPAALPKATTVYVVSGTATLLNGSITVTLVGTYNTSDDSVHISGVTGGGTPVSFVGVYKDGVLSGNYTWGAISGSFSAQQNSSGGDTATVYLGTYQSSSGGGSGTLNMVIKGGKLVGAAVNASGSAEDRIPFGGTVSGDSVFVTIQAGFLSSRIARGAFTDAGHLHAEGVYDTRDLGGDNGVWSMDKH
jgi:hypothetical protein